MDDLRGTGRTYRKMLRVAVYACDNPNKNAVVIDFNPTSSNHSAQMLCDVMFPLLRSGWAKFDYSRRVMTCDNGTRVEFHTADNRPDKYQGRILDVAYIDHYVKEEGLTPRYLRAKIVE